MVEEGIEGVGGPWSKLHSTVFESGADPVRSISTSINSTFLGWQQMNPWLDEHDFLP